MVTALRVRLILGLACQPLAPVWVKDEFTKTRLKSPLSKNSSLRHFYLTHASSLFMIESRGWRMETAIAYVKNVFYVITHPLLHTRQLVQCLYVEKRILHIHLKLWKGQRIYKSNHCCVYVISGTTQSLHEHCESFICDKQDILKWHIIKIHVYVRRKRLWSVQDTKHVGSLTFLIYE